MTLGDSAVADRSVRHGQRLKLEGESRRFGEPRWHSSVHFGNSRDYRRNSRSRPWCVECPCITPALFFTIKVWFVVSLLGGVVAQLYNFYFLIIFLIGVAIVFLTSEFGWQLGIRTKLHGASGNISALEQSLLGLLALIIGFTFLMALTRFEGRREAVVNEANAIGTTALRARLLPAPHRAESLKLLREYAQIRIIPAGMSFAELPALLDRSNTIQEALWQQVKALSAKDNSMVPTGLFIQALNEMIDNQGKRVAASQNFIPYIVLLMLSAMAAAACGFAGYASGIDPLRTRLPVFITAVLVCSVIFVTLDLDRPNAGFIKISQQPMIDTLASLSAFKD